MQFKVIENKTEHFVQICVEFYEGILTNFTGKSGVFGGDVIFHNNRRFVSHHPEFGDVFGIHGGVIGSGATSI